MTKKLGRGAFLRTTGGAMAAGAAFLYPGIDKALAARPTKLNRAQASPNSSIVTLDGPDPTYGFGEVTQITGDWFVLSSDLGTQTIDIRSNAVVWKEFDLDRTVINLGDWIDAKVDPQPDGTRLARSGWISVNIGRHDGVFQGISPKGELMSLSHDGHLFALEISKRLVVEHVEDASPIPGGLASLRVGEFFSAVGLRLPQTKSLRVTRVWK